MQNRDDCSIEVIRTSAGLDRVKADWDQLYAASGGRNPFLSYGWTRGCWDTQGHEGALFIVTLRIARQLAGVAPLCIGKRLGLRVLRFIGDGRSDYLGFLTAPGIARAEARLLEALVVLQPEWDLTVLRQLTEDYSSLGQGDLPASLAYHRVAASVAPYAACDCGWDRLHEIGPGWLKRTRKRLPRFLRDGWSIERFTGAEAASRLAAVATIEARSWKGQQGVSRLQPGPGQNLMRHAFEPMAMRGEIELWLASIDGSAAAFQINFLPPGRLWIYQQAYEAGHHRASPGSFMAYLAIRRAWLAGAREYDYLCGDDPYKNERTNAVRTISHLALHPRTLRGRLAFALLLAARWTLKDIAVLRAARNACLRARGALRPPQHQS